MRILGAIVEPTTGLPAIGVADLFHRRGIRAKPVPEQPAARHTRSRKRSWNLVLAPMPTRTSSVRLTSTLLGRRSEVVSLSLHSARSRRWRLAVGAVLALSLPDLGQIALEEIVQERADHCDCCDAADGVPALGDGGLKNVGAELKSEARLEYFSARFTRMRQKVLKLILGSARVRG